LPVAGRRVDAYRDTPKNRGLLMLELARTVHEGLGFQSTAAFVSVFALVGALIFGMGAYFVDRTYKNQVANEQASRPTANEVAQRTSFRNQVGELLKRGRIHQANLLSISQGRMPDPRERAGKLAVAITQWHVEVATFFGVRFGQAEADRIGVPAPSLEYPPRIMEGVTYVNGKSVGGYDLRTAWDSLVGDLAALEKLLADYPELRQ
jgi:hypothetical protein